MRTHKCIFGKNKGETYGRSQQVLRSNGKGGARCPLGISRSSFYKYKDDIFPFKEKTKGENITFILQMDDEPGLLSAVLAAIAQFHGNILTIHQSIPMNGVAGLTLSVAILPTEGDAAAMVDNIEHIKGVHYLKILGRE